MTDPEVDDEMSRELNTLAAAYALDALPRGERAEFESRLPDFPELDREVAELRAAAGLLAAPLAVPVPDRVRSLVLTRISGVRQLPPLVAEGAPWIPRRSAASAPAAAPPSPVADLGAWRARHAARLSGGRRSFLVAAVAAVAAAAVVLGVDHARPSTTSPFAAVLAQPDVRTTQVAAGGAHAVLAWSRAEKRVVVQLNSMPDAPTGHTYQLWLIPTRGAAVSKGTFEPVDGSATLPADGLASNESVGITVEPAGGSRQPTTSPIMAVRLT